MNSSLLEAELKAEAVTLGHSSFPCCDILSGWCLWASRVFQFHIPSVLKTPLCTPEVVFIYGDQILRSQGLQEILTGHMRIHAQCTGPSDAPDGMRMNMVQSCMWYRLARA